MLFRQRAETVPLPSYDWLEKRPLLLHEGHKEQHWGWIITSFLISQWWVSLFLSSACWQSPAISREGYFFLCREIHGISGHSVPRLSAAIRKVPGTWDISQGKACSHMIRSLWCYCGLSEIRLKLRVHRLQSNEYWRSKEWISEAEHAN